MSKSIPILLLSLILIVSLLLRMHKLGNVPNGLTVDEADMAYNSFSIYKTGHDVYGKKLPLFFQSLDDYKAGFGIYAPIPAIATFGLNEFSIRFTPALMGSITPILVFVLAKLLFSQSKIIPPVAALLTVFAPWNIAISRANLPYIELVFFYLVFLIVFLLAALKNHKLLPLAAIVLAFTLYVYYAAVIYLFPLMASLIIIYRKFFIKHLKVALFSFAVLASVSIPAVVHYQSKEAKTRLNAISVLTPDITLPTSIVEMQDDQSAQRPLSLLLHNRRLVYLNAMFNNYLDYFNLDYLFVNAKNVRYFYVNGVGLFYLVELPFFFLGVYKLLAKRKKNSVLLLSLLALGPIPAMPTLGSPFPHRGILLILTIQLISAVGVATLIEVFTKIKFKFAKPSISAIAAIYLLSVYFFLHQYFIHTPHEFTSEFDNGAWFSTVRDVIPTVNALKNNYDKVVFTWSQNKLVPMIYFLSYNQVDPTQVQKKAALWTNEPPSYKQIYNQVDNIEFRPIDWDQDKNLKNTLLIGYSSEFPQNVEEIVGRTYLPNGRAHFLLVKTQ